MPQENPSLRKQDLGDVLVRLGIDDGEGDTVAPPPAQLVDAVQVKVRIEQNGARGDLIPTASRIDRRPSSADEASTRSLRSVGYRTM